MRHTFTRFAQITTGSVFLFAFHLNIASAGDHWRREPTVNHTWSGRYTREASHGLIHYPTTTYWMSGSTPGEVDRWDPTDMPTYSSYDIAPSPWAYRSIAPYRHQYYSAEGTGYCFSGCCDCRN